MPQGNALCGDGVRDCHADVNGTRYHYLLAQPASGPFRATVFLIHGWPDLSEGWRFQIPALVDLGLRVVCPDMMGYGDTDTPRARAGDDQALAKYSQKRASDDIKELARQLGAHKIILGGHDWGGAIVYRCAAFHPDLVTHVFSVCTPFQPPSKTYMPLEQVIERAPQFGYQAHLAGPEVEAKIVTEKQIRQFLNGMYGARGSKREVTFSPEKGILFEHLPTIGKSSLLSDAEMDYYVKQYARNGLHGPLNWYRMRKINHDDEQSLSKPGLDMPVLFITATKDNVLLPSMSRGMEKFIPNLSRAEVVAGHWALWQATDRVNSILKGWFDGVVFGGKSKL